MILEHCDISEFLFRIEGKRLVCFGAGRELEQLVRSYPEMQTENHIAYIVDNNSDLWGGKKVFSNGASIPVYAPHKLVSEKTLSDIIIVISSSSFWDEILRQLNSMPNLYNTECYFSMFLLYESHNCKSRTIPRNRINNFPIIPAIIHYFWFGDRPLPDKHKKFIDGWREHCPGFEIVEWNERNYDVTKFQYTRDAALAGRWSKVATYARFDVINRLGGICLDTDVEVIKPLDELLYNNAFVGFGDVKLINSGSGFGAIKNFKLFDEMRENYDDTLFNSDGTANLAFNSKFETEFLITKGLVADGSFQMVDGLTVYPPECFSPMPTFINTDTGIDFATSATFSIQHYDTTLADPVALVKRDLRSELFLSISKPEQGG